MVGDHIFAPRELLVHLDQQTAQRSQSPDGARRLVNLIPSRAGDLRRKSQAPPFISANAPNIGGSPAWFSGAQDYIFTVSGAPQRQTIVKVSNNIGTFLYRYSSGSVTPLPAGAFSPPHNAAAGWVGDPVLLHVDRVLYISDGLGSWSAYDGVRTWKGGLDIPFIPSIISSAAGSIRITTFADYVVTEFDDGTVSGRPHESPPSAHVRFTPAEPGNWDVTVGMPAAVKNVAPGTAADWTTGYPTHWRVYRSYLDGASGAVAMYRIAEIAIASTQYVDTNPMWGDAAATNIIPERPPLLNHKPKPSLVAAVYQNRIVMRDEDKRDHLWFTGGVEVRQQGSLIKLEEVVPGARNTELDDFENTTDELFIATPDESSDVRTLIPVDDGLLVGTERSATFIWGRNVETFAASAKPTYRFGFFHRNAVLMTSHGLVIFNSEKKLVLDPAIRSAADDRTEKVIDIGWEIQPELDKADIRFSNRFQMAYYNFGQERDWLVVAITSQNIIDGGVGRLFVYDFAVKTWMQFDDVAATSIDVVQEDEGFKFLVAGNSGANRSMRVVADYNPSASSSYAAAAARMGLPGAGATLYPANVWRTALLEPGGAEMWRVLRKISFYKKGGFTVVVRAWYDPADVDTLDPGDADTLTFTELSSKEWEGWIQQHVKRVVFEITIAASAHAGSMERIALHFGDKASSGV